MPRRDPHGSVHVDVGAVCRDLLDRDESRWTLIVRASGIGDRQTANESDPDASRWVRSDDGTPLYGLDREQAITRSVLPDVALLQASVQEPFAIDADDTLGRIQPERMLS